MRKKDFMLDYVIKQGKTIDGRTIEIGMKDGKIVEVAPEVTSTAKKEITLQPGEYLSAGWIDCHVHCYENMDLYYDYPDKVGVETGVTSVIDAGTTGAETIGDFYQLAQNAKTNVYALLNISKWGIVEQDELADLSKVSKEAAKKAIEQYSDFIVGLKARMSKTVIGENGITPLERAKEIQAENDNIPLMVHIGSTPPELQDIFQTLESGDVVTHCFNGKANGIFDTENQTIKDFAWDAYKKGLYFDIGHGTDSFNFDVATQAFAEGMKAHTISTDIYSRNRENGPVFDFATTLEKLRVVGYSWEEIIEKVTVAPAKCFNLEGKGQLKVGNDADITVFTIDNQEKTLIDSNGNERLTKEVIRPVKTIVKGNVYDNSL